MRNIIIYYRAHVFLDKTLEHELRTPKNKAFFHQKPKILALGRQFGQINFGAFGVFLNDLSAPILEL